MSCIDICDQFSHSQRAEIIRYYKSRQIKLNERVKPELSGKTSWSRVENLYWMASVLSPVRKLSTLHFLWSRPVDFARFALRGYLEVGNNYLRALHATKI